ncbi:MAG: Transcriptional regulator KdgR [Verrucomicrobiota bacterium]
MKFPGPNYETVKTAEHVPYKEPADSTGSAHDASQAPALSRGLALLEKLSEFPNGLSLTQLSAAIDSPKNSTSRLIQTLIASVYAVRDEATLLIRLTGKVLQLVHPRAGDLSFVECALPMMRDLREQTGETVLLGVAIADEVVIIEKLESRKPIRIGVDVGLRLDLHNNAPGKVIVAFQHPRERERVIRRIKLTPTTPHTITDREELRRECDRIVEQGYGTDREEHGVGIRCVAAPVFQRPNQILGCIWVSAPSGRLTESDFGTLAPLVTQAARAIEQRLSL